MKKATSRLTILVGLACILSIASGAQAGGEEFTESFRLDQCTFASSGRNPYFILDPGHKLVLEGIENKQLVRLEITVLYETKTIAGVRTRVVKELETKDSQLVEISWNYFALCTQNNSAIYFGEDVDIYENGVVASHAGAWRAGVHGARAGVIMPGLALLGARYFQEIAPKVAMDRAEILDNDDSLATPAGVFSNVLETEETTPLEPNSKGLKFYAPGIGLIQDGVLKLVWFSGL